VKAIIPATTVTGEKQKLEARSERLEARKTSLVEISLLTSRF